LKNYHFSIGQNIVFIDVANNNLSNNIKKKSIVMILIDFNNIKDNKYELIIRKIKKLKIKCITKKADIGITHNAKVIIGSLYNYDENNEKHKDILISINAILQCNIKQRYNYLYDKICEYLDYQFRNKNLCGFENNKCVPRKHIDRITGCCHHFKNKRFRYVIFQQASSM